MTLPDPRLDHSGPDAPARRVEPGPSSPPQAMIWTSPSAVLPAGAHSSPPAVEVAIPEDGLPVVDPSSRQAPMTLPLGGNQSPPPASTRTAPKPALPVVDPLLFVHATTHGDLEQLRIATQHRLRILTATEPDDDGVMRGFGLNENHPDVAQVAGILQALVVLENQATLGLKRALRKCGIHPWVKAQVGLGEKQVARLLGAIGDPYWHLAEDRPRTVSELWAYSGLHVLPASHTHTDAQRAPAGGANLPDGSQPRFDPQRDRAAVGNQTSDPGQRSTDALGECAGVAAKRRKGQKANWSTEAKTRAYLVAVSCMKQARSPYRAVYLTRREHTAITHPDWTPGHSHNDGLRITSKAILRDLWRESKRLHTGTADNT